MTQTTSPRSLDDAFRDAHRRIALAHNTRAIDTDTRNEAVLYAFDLYNTDARYTGDAVRALDAILPECVDSSRCGQVYPYFTDLDGRPFVCPLDRGHSGQHLDVDVEDNTVVWS